MNTNISPAIPYDKNLLKTPGENIMEFENYVLNAYATTGTAYDNHGLLFIVATDIQWSEARGNTVAGVTAPRPVFDLPAEPAANASAAILAQHAMRSKRFKDIQDSVQALKARTIASISEADINVLSHETNLMREYTDRQILDAMLLKYNRPTAVIIQKYKDQLAEPIKDDEEFDSFSAGHKKVHSKLLRALQPVSEFDKCDKLQKATARRSEVSEAIRTFKVANPRVDQLIFADLVAHVIEQALNMCVSSAAAGYAGSMTGPSIMDMQKMIDDAMARGFAGGLAHAAAQGKPNSTSGSPPNYAAYSCYCYFHGYCNSHVGIDCKVMKTPRAPLCPFTAAQRNAKNHKEIAGGSKNCA